MATFVLTLLGDDRPGLVSALSSRINAHGASWERSQMSRLAGKFAGIAVVTVADDRYDALVGDLEGLGADGLQVTLDRTDAPEDTAPVHFTLDLLGSDRPGIVAEISAALAAQRIGFEELHTDVREAPMAGGMLFEARAVLEASPALDLDDLRVRLEAIADELMVDIVLSDAVDAEVH